MAASSITKNFIVYGTEQAEKFADAIEKSYQESIKRTQETDLQITYLRGAEEIDKFMSKRKNANE